MNEEELKRLFKETSAPTVRLEAQEEAVRRARRAWEAARRLPQDSGPPARLPKWKFPRPVLASLAGVAVFCLVASIALWKRADVPAVVETAEPESQTEPTNFEREKRVLREVEELFEGRVQFIVIKNGDATIEVAPDAVFGQQAVLMELRRGGESWRIISFSGNTVELEIDGEVVEFEVLVAGDGEVIMAGRDFIWSSGSGSVPARLSIEAVVI